MDTSINLKSIINSRVFGRLKMVMWLLVCVLGLASGQQDFQDLLDQVYIGIDRPRSLLDFMGLGFYWLLDKPAINQLLARVFDLGKESKNQNGNLRWHLPLGVRPPPPLMAKFPDIFLPHFFSFAIESYIYETDFTLQKYQF